jgi:hypothetical protein
MVLSGGDDRGDHRYFFLGGPLGKYNPGAGLNLQADEAYVVAPPSLHASGRQYLWEASSEPDDLPLAPLPDWLKALGQDHAAAAAVTLPDALPAVDIRTIPVSTRIKYIIQTGEDPQNPTRFPSRSEALFTVLLGLVGAGCDDGTIAAIVMNRRYAISEKVWDQKNPKSPTYEAQTRQWLAGDIGRARAAQARQPADPEPPEPPDIPDDPAEMEDLLRRAQAQARSGRNGQAHDPETGAPPLNPLFPHDSANQCGPTSATTTTTSEENPLNPLFPQPVPLPTMAEQAYYGLAGRLVKTIEPHSEADPVALLAQTLELFGVVVGRGPHFLVEATSHHTNLNMALMGKTSKARKGTSYDRIEAIMKRMDASWSLANTIGGCGSGEGIIHAVRDPIRKRETIKEKGGKGKGGSTRYEDVVTDPGVSDKRLLIYEPEFASVLKVTAREGNILSMTLRQAWESGNLQTTVKHNPERATNAHISVIGHITTVELTRLLTTTEAASGFGNRFLWFCVQRSKELPDGGNLRDTEVNALVTALDAAYRHATQVKRMTRDVEATHAWHAVYSALSADRAGLPGVLLARAEAQVLRLSMIYALLDGSAEIRAAHLTAALAVWEYVEASVAYVFGTTTGNKDADVLLHALRGATQGRMSKTQIANDVFHKHIKAAALNEAIRILAEAGTITYAYEPSEGGRKTEYICYGTGPSASSNACAHFIVLSEIAITQYREGRCEHDCQACGKSGKSGKSPLGGADTGEAQNAACAEEVGKSGKSPEEDAEETF